MIDKKNNNKNFCWLFLRTSLGEFHVIAPELINFAEYENLELRISFLTDKIKKQFFDNLLYMKLAELHFEVVEREDIIAFAQQNKKRIKYLFQDLSIINQYSVARSLRIILPAAKLILFPHAFAFYVSKELSNYQTLKIPSRNKFEDCVDAFIIFTEADKNYFSKRFCSDIITVFTPRGLSEEWLYKLQGLISNKEIKDFEVKYPKRVLLTLRHPHPVYLSEKNYFGLLEEVIEVANNFGYELFIKPHPRQDLQDLLDYCVINDLHLWTLDTYTSVLFFDHVITYWSSASIDFAAFGIPSIEHFRYEKYHNQLIQKNGKMSSLYVNMGLSLSSANKTDLELTFEKMIKESHKVGNEQQKKLREAYNSPRLNLNSMMFSKHKDFSFLMKIKHFASLYYNIYGISGKKMSIKSIWHHLKGTYVFQKN